MFGDLSAIQDMIITLGKPETCRAEVHNEVMLIHHKDRKLLAYGTGRELFGFSFALLFSGLAAFSIFGGTAYQIGSGTYQQDLAVSFAP